jgi:hypothetical protein
MSQYFLVFSFVKSSPHQAMCPQHIALRKLVLVYDKTFADRYYVVCVIEAVSD